MKANNKQKQTEEEKSYKELWGEVRGQLIAHTNNPDIKHKYDYNGKTKKAWNKAIKIFQDRLHNYFLKPMWKLLEMEDKKGEGFAVVTLECTLIEMLQAFKEGKIFKHDNPDSSKYEYKDSGEMFKRFLKDANISNSLTSDEELCKTFYSEVRCGLMHAARTNGDWTIKLFGEECSNCQTQATDEKLKQEKDKYKKIANPLSSKPKNIDSIIRFFCKEKDSKERDFIEKKKIYRTILFFKLIRYIRQYCKDLEEKNENGKELRRNFARCMDHLFDFKPSCDPTTNKYTDPDWWVEVSQTTNASQQSATNGSNTITSAP